MRTGIVAQRNCFFSPPGQEMYSEKNSPHLHLASPEKKLPEKLRRYAPTKGNQERKKREKKKEEKKERKREKGGEIERKREKKREK